MVVFVLIVLYITRLNLICAALLWRFVYQIYIVVEWHFVNDIDKYVTSCHFNEVQTKIDTTGEKVARIIFWLQALRSG